MLERISKKDIPLIFKEIDKNEKWVRCPSCGNEFNKLTRKGLCLDCAENREAEARRAKERKEKNFLLDKVEEKFRADING